MVEDNVNLLKELQEIKQVLLIQSRDAVRKEIETFATTAERKEMWKLCDGTKPTDDIAKLVGVSSRAVSYFVEEATNRQLMVLEKRGFPKRKFDYVPVEWPPYKKKVIAQTEQPTINPAEVPQHGNSVTQ